jgi:hypothetical protein
LGGAAVTQAGLIAVALGIGLVVIGCLINDFLLRKEAGGAVETLIGALLGLILKDSSEPEVKRRVNEKTKTKPTEQTQAGGSTQRGAGANSRPASAAGDPEAQVHGGVSPSLREPASPAGGRRAPLFPGATLGVRCRRGLTCCDTAGEPR